MQTLSRSRSAHLAAAGPRASQQRIVRVSALSGDKLKRPELKRPDQPKRLFDEAEAEAAAPSAAAAPAAAATAAAAVAVSSDGGVSIEYQRQRAKEMRKYFEGAKLEQLTTKAQVFGWTPSNELGNGRWVMFGFIVGMMTELATGVDFIHQLEQIVTYTGLWDFE